MRRLFIVHGWGGSPKEGIHKWLKAEAEKIGYEVHVLEMPNSDEPKIEEWVGFLEESVGEIDEESYFFGHSIGCQTILRYLEKLPEEKKVGKVVLLAPWVHLLESAYEEPEEEKKIAKQWLETPLDWEKIKTHSEEFVTIFSDNDFCVPLSDKDIFEGKLGARIIVEHEKGHFTGEDDINDIPVVLEELK